MDTLTREILSHAVRGYSNQEIADRMKVDVEVVRHSLYAAMLEMKATSKLDLFIKALRAGAVE